MDTAENRALAREFLGRWGCEPDGEVFFTHSSLLWPVRRGDAPFMLKIVRPDDNEAHAAELLRYYDGHGAVRLEESEGPVQLLERIEDPSGGTALEEMALSGRDDEATHIICDVIEKLHETARRKDPPVTLIPFRARSDEMRAHMREGRVADKDLPFFRSADDLCAELMAETESGWIALHGDIHHCNVLKSPTRGWLAIDPKGYLGPLAYEYATPLCDPAPRKDLVADPARMDRQASIVAERSGRPKELILRFALLHAMQCAAWSLNQEYQDFWLACGRTAAGIAGIRPLARAVNSC